MGRGECRASNSADLKKQQSHEVIWRMKCVGSGAGRPFKFKMNLEKTEYGDTAALVKYAMTFCKGASVPKSGDGVVRFRARNDIGGNGKRAKTEFPIYE